MKRKFISLFVMLIVISVIFSCQKEEKAKTTFELISGPSCWKFTKEEQKDDAGNWEDVTENIPCELDDCTQFKSDGSYKVNDTGIKCPGQTDPIDVGTWTLSNSDKTFNNGLDCNIVSISEHKFVIEVDEIRYTYTN